MSEITVFQVCTTPDELKKEVLKRYKRYMSVGDYSRAHSLIKDMLEYDPYNPYYEFLGWHFSLMAEKITDADYHVSYKRRNKEFTEQLDELQKILDNFDANPQRAEVDLYSFYFGKNRSQRAILAYYAMEDDDKKLCKDLFEYAKEQENAWSKAFDLKMAINDKYKPYETAQQKSEEKKTKKISFLIALPGIILVVVALAFTIARAIIYG